MLLKKSCFAVITVVGFMVGFLVYTLWFLFPDRTRQKFKNYINGDQ